jgi:glutamate-1-semialdehyde 2,1-aminomutase
MRSYPKSAKVLSANKRFIPGGISSTNRSVDPQIVFQRAEGAYLLDIDGNRFLDYHAAFAPHILGHNDPFVTEAVERVLRDRESLYGSGATLLEGALAEQICGAVPFIDKIAFLNTGSEATYQALRVARAASGRDHVIVMQGGYNGWHNDVACNLMTPLEAIGPRVSPGEYRNVPISAGIPEDHRKLVHIVNFNDLASVEYVCEKYPVAALITEPILQNIGIVQPAPGYLKGLLRLARRYGFILILDEVKTGFRHAVGGYASVAGIEPDLVVYGKALANGYPIAALAGKEEFMAYFVHQKPDRRVLLAGTYNGHPVPTAAAIATVERLRHNDGAVFRYLNDLGGRLESGVRKFLDGLGVTATLARQGSAFCLYFMDHAPVDWHDLAQCHDFELDGEMRRQLIDRGVYFFPLPIKQGSISFAHTAADIDETLEIWKASLADAVVADATRRARRGVS